MGGRFWKDAREILAVDIGFLNQMGGVELTFDDALSAANAKVWINDSASTREATGRFFLDLLFGEHSAVIFIRFGIDWANGRDLTWGIVEAKFVFVDVIDIDLLEIAEVAARFKELSWLDVTMKRDSGFLTGCDSIDCKARAMVAIASDEDIRVSGLQGGRIRENEVPWRKRDTRAFEKLSVIKGLANG